MGRILSAVNFVVGKMKTQWSKWLKSYGIQMEPGLEAKSLWVVYAYQTI